MIDNYIRFMKGPRASAEHIVCFDSRDQADIDRMQLEVRQRHQMKAVVWKKTYPFEHLPEVGQMRWDGPRGDIDGSP